MAIAERLTRIHDTLQSAGVVLPTRTWALLREALKRELQDARPDEAADGYPVKTARDIALDALSEIAGDANYDPNERIYAADVLLDQTGD